MTYEAQDIHTAMNKAFTEMELPSLELNLYEGIRGRTVWKSATDESDSKLRLFFIVYY